MKYGMLAGFMGFTFILSFSGIIYKVLTPQTKTTNVINVILAPKPPPLSARMCTVCMTKSSISCAPYVVNGFLHMCHLINISRKCTIKCKRSNHPKKWSCINVTTVYKVFHTNFP